MKRLLLFPVLIIMTTLALTGQQKLNSSVYDWEKLNIEKTASGSVRNILKAPTRSLSMFEMVAVTLLAGQTTGAHQVADRTTEMVIIKDGIADIDINRKRSSLEAGSVIVASPGDRIAVSNPGKTELVCYLFTFKPDPARIQKQTSEMIPPVLCHWNDIEFKLSANGGRRDIIRQRTSALKELEIHVTTLNEGLPSHNAHVHPDEEIILVKKGIVEETINGKPYRLGAGSVIFLTNDDLHGISNTGKGQCEYYAIRWLIE